MIENLEKRMEAVFGCDILAWDRGVITESVRIVNDKYPLSDEQVDEALKYLFSIKDSFLGNIENISTGEVWDNLSEKIIEHLNNN